jgi:hypothetical protein
MLKEPQKMSDFCEIARRLVKIFHSCKDVHKAKKLSVNIFPIFQKLCKCVFLKTKIQQFVKVHYLEKCFKNQ